MLKMSTNNIGTADREVVPISDQNENVDQNELAKSTGEPETGVTEPAVQEPEKSPRNGNSRQISISVRTLVASALIVIVVAALGILTWLYLGEKAKVDAAAQQAANYSRAEQISLDYAVKAARIDYKDLDGWKKNLVENTTPELSAKLTDAGKSMEQLLVPLQWNSTTTPLVAKVRSNDKGVYVVDTFVGVNTKTMQAPEGLGSTATYSVTVDSNHDWQISEVGGIGSVVGQK
jgi:Mce-associated membrane protein